MTDLPEVYIYMLESMDGFGTGEFLEKAGDAVGDYFKREYSFGTKAILCGRPTWEQGLPYPISKLIVLLIWDGCLIIALN